MKKEMIHIIGGGISGLSLAWLLSQKGYPVTVIESQGQLGGNASWVKLNNHTVDCFYHIITGEDTYFFDLIKELGLSERLFPVRTRMGFYKEGTIHPVSTLKEFFSFRPISFLGRMRMANCLMRSMMIKDWQRLDSLTARQWLSDLCGKKNYELLWKPVMQSKFGPATDEIVATDMWFRINRIGSLNSRKIKKGTYYIKGGLKLFFETLEDKLTEMKVTILKGKQVRGLRAKDRRIEALKLNSGTELPCDNAIFTGSLPDFIQLLPKEEEEYIDRLKKIRYLNNVTLILLLKKRFSSFYQLNIGEEGFPFTGIIGADILYPPNDFGGGHVLYLSKYFIGESEYLKMDAESIFECYFPYLKKVCPSFERDWVMDQVVVAKNNVEAMHTLNYSGLIPQNRTCFDNLFLLCAAQIYPEPTVLDASFKYAGRFLDNFLARYEE